MSESRIYPVPKDFSDTAYIDKALYEELYQKSIADPEAFWAEQAGKLLNWSKKWDRVMDFDFRSGQISWFEGGRINATVNCLDRHLGTRGDQAAIIWESDQPDEDLVVTYAELYEKVYSHGPLGKYLVDQLIEFNLGNQKRPMAMEFRSLGDSPAVAVTIYPDCGTWSWQPAPEIEQDMTYVHNKYKGRNRPIRVYENIDSRFILEDFFAKLKAHVSSGS